MALNQSSLAAYAAIGLGFLGVIGIFLRFQGPMEIVSAMLCGGGSVLAILFYKYGYIFVPMLTQQTRTVVMTDTGYEIPPSQDAIIKKGETGTYYASMFLGIRIYESVSEKSQEQIVTYNEFFERAISNLKFVTKISYLLYVEDVGEKRKIIESKRAEAQLRLARERDKPEADVLRIDRYEREVAKWDTELQKIIKGIKPMGAVAYAMTTATGVTAESALAAARNQSQELKAVLTNALNVEIEVLTADQLLKAFEWERMIPQTGQDLESAVV